MIINKIFFSVEELAKEIQKIKKDQVIVYTGGAFDLFHYGHLRYLERVASFGNCCIVHVDSDKHVRDKKGSSRPVINEMARAEIISSLPFVNYILISDQKFYSNEYIRKLKPNIIIKVARTEQTKTTRAREVKLLKTVLPKVKVFYIKPTSNISTTQLIKKICSSDNMFFQKENVLSKIDQKLLDIAKKSSLVGYSYSGFQAGAAILANNGKTYSGCNLTNSSPSLTICAERMAIAAALSDGVKYIKKVVLFSQHEQTITPCGLCRQVIFEFSDKKTQQK